jgi:AcrR family transcriptional regulator
VSAGYLPPEVFYCAYGRFMATERAVPRPDPLTEIVLCPTTGRSVTDPQVWTPSESTRTRLAAVARSRACILDGARRAVEIGGSRITMTQIAASAGVAKATLYNHFRTRDDVLAALLLEEIDAVIVRVGHRELAPALIAAATELSTNPLLEALGGEDLVVLAELARIDVRAPGWLRVARATDALLEQAGRQGTPTVLRWLSSFLIAPADDRDIAADVAVLVAGLPVRV